MPTWAPLWAPNPTAPTAWLDGEWDRTKLGPAAPNPEQPQQGQNGRDGAEGAGTVLVKPLAPSPRAACPPHPALCRRVGTG